MPTSVCYNSMTRLRRLLSREIWLSTSGCIRCDSALSPQLAAAVPSYEQGRISGNPKDPLESVKIVSTRYGKPPVHSNWGFLLDPPFITKKDDPGMPTITCEIRPQLFHNVFCDLGSSVNIMSKVIYENLLGCILLPTFMRLQTIGDEQISNKR